MHNFTFVCKPVLHLVLALSSLLASITAEVLQIVSTKETVHIWELCFQELLLFRTRHGHCSPTRNSVLDESEGLPGADFSKKLGLWVMSQRNARRSGRLEKCRKKRLDAIGFVWSPQDLIWNKKYLQLAKFVQANNHCSVPLTGCDGLGRWVSTQRLRRGKSGPSTRFI
jgi:hypothetical protein